MKQAYKLDNYGLLVKINNKLEESRIDKKDLFYISEETAEKLKDLSNTLSEKLKCFEELKRLELIRMRLIINNVDKRNDEKI